MTIEIATLTPSDFEFYSKISVREEQARFVFPAADVLSRFAGRDAEAYVLIGGAKKGGEAAGIIVVTSYYETAEIPNKALNACWVDTLAIDKNHQRQGVGLELTKAAISALDGKFDCIYLTVNVRNQPARCMYTQCGFKDTGEIYRGGLSGPQHVLSFDLSDRSRLKDRG